MYRRPLRLSTQQYCLTLLSKELSPTQWPHPSNHMTHHVDWLFSIHAVSLIHSTNHPNLLSQLFLLSSANFIRFSFIISHYVPHFTLLYLCSINWSYLFNLFSMDSYFLSLFLFTSRGCNFPLLHFTIKRLKDCSSLLVPPENLPERSDMRKSFLDILTQRSMYFSHAAYQYVFLPWSSAPDPLCRPRFIIVKTPLTTGCFVVAAVIDAIFVANGYNKDCLFFF